MSDARDSRTDSPDPAGKPERRPPSPYLFSLILIAMGLWFAYDGFLNAAFMEKHAGDGILAFNRYGAGVLVAWGALDFYRMWRRQRRRALAREEAPPGS
ncbi:MAG: hypothetical protein ACE5IL_13035 [Myxococcota bacterium]